MALREIAVKVKSFNGKCNTDCLECELVRGVVPLDFTVNGSGILEGSVVPRAIDNAAVWTEGCYCYANFQYDDVQLVPDVELESKDICLVCGCIIEYIARIGTTIEFALSAECPAGYFVGVP